MNRNKLTSKVVGNLSNAVIHKVLEKAIDDKEIANKYEKELTTSLEIARRYREKINPADVPLPDRDKECIRKKAVQKVTMELVKRVRKGYQNIDMGQVQGLVDAELRKMKILN